MAKLEDLRAGSVVNGSALTGVTNIESNSWLGDQGVTSIAAKAHAKHLDVKGVPQEQMVLRRGPCPLLPEKQQKVVELDYGMRSGKTKIKVRRTFLYYTLKRLGLDTDPAARRPQDQQIVLLNRPELALPGAASREEG